VVVGQGIVAAGFFLVFNHVLRPEQLPVIAHPLAARRKCPWQDAQLGTRAAAGPCAARVARRQDRLQVIHHPHALCDVHAGRRSGPVLLNLGPGLTLRVSPGPRRRARPAPAPSHRSACRQSSACDSPSPPGEPQVATSSFPSLTLTFTTPAGAGGTGLFRSTKSPHENRHRHVARLGRGGGSGSYLLR
jgi:hypothetical protein